MRGSPNSDTALCRDRHKSAVLFSASSIVRPSRVAKAVLVSAVPPLMVRTDTNPGGTPIEAFDGLRKALADNRAAFFLDLRNVREEARNQRRRSWPTPLMLLFNRAL